MIHHKLKFLNNGERSFINSHLKSANGLKQACRSVSGIEEALILVKKKSTKMLDINKKKLLYLDSNSAWVFFMHFWHINAKLVKNHKTFNITLGAAIIECIL